MIDLLFNIVLPIAIVYTFMTMAYTPDHVRGILLAFVCAFATHLVGGVLGQLCFRHRSPMERGRVPLPVCCFPTPAFWRCLWLWR